MVILLLTERIGGNANISLLGWAGVNFRLSSWYGAVLWICSGNHIDTEMF